MKNIKYIMGWSVLLTLSFFQVNGQEILSKTDAVAIALENNFDIRSVKNNVEIAENNAGILNSGYLPSATGSGGANYTIANSKNIKPDTTVVLKGIETNRYNATIGLNYTVFDGFGRKYNYEKLKTNFNLSDLQARQVMENTLLNVFNSYYEIARLTQNELSQRQTLDISKERLLRTKYSADYGQKTQLDVLNAEVDLNNDSINYLNIKQQLQSEKYNLNLLLGRGVQTAFDIDTTLLFTESFDIALLLDHAFANNSALLQQELNVENAERDINIATSGLMPKVGLNANYAWQNSANGPISFFPQTKSNALNYGATFTWNLFDGGSTLTKKQNSRLALENQQILMDQTKLNLERNVSNAWTVYQTALFVMQAENKNLETNKRNFDRTQEQFSLGQITSIVFRQAQFNLLNAQLNYNKARYSAKTAELALLQLSGDILKMEF